MTKKLLLADDSITIQKVIGIIFSTEDYQLLVTDNGDDAYTQALEELPDLVIADISMPGKDGFELCEAIKSDSRLSNASVMLLPGAFDHFDEERAQAVGADGWLTKPFESQALLNKVEQLLAADPIRLAGDAPVDESLAEFAAPVVEESEVPPVVAPIVDEAVLGLAKVEEPALVEEVVEESPEDIWDAVSFEDEDIQEQAEPVAEGLTEEADLTFDDLSALGVVAEEPEDESPLELVDELVVEESVAEDLVVEDSEPLSFESEEQDMVEDDELLVLQDEEEPLELVDELVESSAIEMPAELEAEGLGPVELADEDLVAEASELVDDNILGRVSEVAEASDSAGVGDDDIPLARDVSWFSQIQ